MFYFLVVCIIKTYQNLFCFSSLLNMNYLRSYFLQIFPNERSSQTAAQAMDSKGIMYFGLMEPPSIWCWNSATEYTSTNFHQVAVNTETLQFASGVKIINNLEGVQELWVLTSSFQRVMTGSLSSSRINFRVHTEKVPIILANSPCLSAA